MIKYLRLKYKQKEILKQVEENVLQADNAKVNRLLKTARGQIDGILKMIEEDRYCVDISAQLMATQGIINKANKEVISAHMKGCIKQAIIEDNCDDKIDELIAIIDKLTK